MTEKALDKKIETLRALLGQDKDSTLGLSKPSTRESLGSNSESIEINDANQNSTPSSSIEKNIVKPLPKATKTFTPRDFIHFKKHSNEQSLVLIKRFFSKHGRPKENSSELNALTNAISRIISKSAKK